MEFNAAERTSLRIRTEISGTIEIKLSGISGKPKMHGELLSKIRKAQHISLLFWMDMKEHHESAKVCMFSILIRVFTMLFKFLACRSVGFRSVGCWLVEGFWVHFVMRYYALFFEL